MGLARYPILSARTIDDPEASPPVRVVQPEPEPTLMYLLSVLVSTVLWLVLAVFAIVGIMILGAAEYVRRLTVSTLAPPAVPENQAPNPLLGSLHGLQDVQQAD